MNRISRPLLAIPLAVVLVLILALLVRQGQTVRAGETCGNLPEQNNTVVVSFDPGIGQPGDPFTAGLDGAPASVMDGEVRVFLNSTIFTPGGTFAGSGTLQETITSIDVPATVPAVAPDDYYVVICWDFFEAATAQTHTYWWFNDVPFVVTAAPTTAPATVTTTAAPTTAAPTPTSTITATPIPTVTPTEAPSPTPAHTLPPLNQVKPFSFNPIPPLVWQAPFHFAEDLSFFGIEVTEGIQCFDTSKGLSGCPDNSLPLVSQKNATARIYMKYAGPSPLKLGIPVRLHILANGNEYIVNTSGNADKVLSRSFNMSNVWFNADFDGDVDLSFYAEVDPINVYPETNESNNRYPASGTMDVHFYKRATFDVVGWRMNYHPTGATDAGVASGWAMAWGGADWLNTVWPVRTGGITYNVHSGFFDWPAVIPAGGSGAVVATMKMIILGDWIFPWLDPLVANADRVHVWTPRSHFVRGLSDPPWGGAGFGVASVGDDSPGASMTMDSPGFGAVNFAHEVSHNTGLYHTAIGKPSCDTSGGGLDWPYADASIQEYGYNPDSGNVYIPNLTYDLMSYCYGAGNPSWISPFHWAQQFSIEGASAGPVHIESTGGDVIAVQATLDNPDLGGDTGGSLGTMYKTEGGGNNAATPPGSGYTVQLRNGDQVLRSQSFGVGFVPVDAEDPNEVLGSIDVAFTMAWADGATSVVLLRGTTVLDTAQVSGHGPTVQVTSPTSPAQWAAGTTETLTWAGDDEDGDPLTYAVYYAPDGEAWTILDIGITTTSYDVVVDALAGGEHARFRVLASDGVNTSFGDSAEVSIPNKPPLVAITGPGDGKLVAEGGLVVLSGGAVDLEDGTLSDAALEWSSDKDGDLGVGGSLPINTLSAGEHMITLKATDSDGASSSQSITVIVGVLGRLDVRPVAIDPDGHDELLVVLTLPPGIPVADVKQNTLRIQIGDTELTPTSVDMLADLDLDGLPSLKLLLDGDAARAAFGVVPSTAQVVIDLTGEMDDGSALAAHGTTGLIHPGDVDCSGETDETDVTQALGYDANVGTSPCLFAGDLDCDGDVTPLDALGILGGIAGIDVGATSCPAPESPVAATGTPFEEPSGGAAVWHW